MTESPIDVWIRQAIPPGSGRYYALLHCDNQARLSATLTLFSIWSKLSFSNVEIEAAKKKFDWWQHELTNSPQHPVTTTLLANIPEEQTQSLMELLRAVLNGYGALLTDGSPSRDESNHHFHQHTGAVAALSLVNPQQADEKKQLTAIGTQLSKLRCVRHMHKHVSNGLLCLPYEELQQLNISPAHILPGNYADPVGVFIKQHLSEISNQLKANLSAYKYRDNAGAKFLYIYATLQLRLADKILSDLTVLDQDDIRLLPIHNFWLANKASRQYRKAQHS